MFFSTFVIERTLKKYKETGQVQIKKKSVENQEGKEAFQMKRRPVGA
jgi:hypothetical protein